MTIIRDPASKYRADLGLVVSSLGVSDLHLKGVRDSVLQIQRPPFYSGSISDRRAPNLTITATFDDACTLSTDVIKCGKTIQQVQTVLNAFSTSRFAVER